MSDALFNSVTTRNLLVDNELVQQSTVGTMAADSILVSNATIDRLNVSNIRTNNEIVSQNLTVSGDIDTSRLNVSGNEAVGGNLSVNGNISTDTLRVSGSEAVGGNLSVTGDIGTSRLNVSSDETIGGDLTVTGDIDTRTLRVSGNEAVGGNLSVNGNIGTNILRASGNVTTGNVFLVSAAGNLTLLGAGSNDQLHVTPNYPSGTTAGVLTQSNVRAGTNISIVPNSSDSGITISTNAILTPSDITGGNNILVTSSGNNVSIATTTTPTFDSVTYANSNGNTTVSGNNGTLTVAASSGSTVIETSDMILQGVGVGTLPYREQNYLIGVTWGINNGYYQPVAFDASGSVPSSNNIYLQPAIAPSVSSVTPASSGMVPPIRVVFRLPYPYSKGYTVQLQIAQPVLTTTYASPTTIVEADLSVLPLEDKLDIIQFIVSSPRAINTDRSTGATTITSLTYPNPFTIWIQVTAMGV